MAHYVKPHKGMDMRDALVLIRKTGGNAQLRKGTGSEWRISHPEFDRRYKVNHDRKTIPRIILPALRKLYAAHVGPI